MSVVEGRVVVPGPLVLTQPLGAQPGLLAKGSNQPGGHKGVLRLGVKAAEVSARLEAIGSGESCQIAWRSLGIPPRLKALRSKEHLEFLPHILLSNANNSLPH